jgi:hypothetical protein
VLSPLTGIIIIIFRFSISPFANSNLLY